LNGSGTWLFDVFADPLEHVDLSQTLPEVVARLEASLDTFLRRNIEQRVCPVDPASSPNKYVFKRCSAILAYTSPLPSLRSAAHLTGSGIGRR
jgi:hypothetical protein